MDNYLIHYGILGQKWGVRRYQEPNGSYTDIGLKRHDLWRKHTFKMASAALGAAALGGLSLYAIKKYTPYEWDYGTVQPKKFIKDAATIIIPLAVTSKAYKEGERMVLSSLVDKDRKKKYGA